MSCLPGQYSGSAGSSSCMLCDQGRFAAASGSNSCSDCQSGSVAATGASSCSACTPGKNAVSDGLSSCTACDVGRYSAAYGLNTSCASCASDFTTAAVGSVSASDCYFDGAIGCDPGYEYVLTEGGSVCSPCEVGWYKPSSGNSDCLQCTAPFATRDIGQHSCSRCTLGYYYNSRADDGEECQTCPAAASCVNRVGNWTGGSTLAQLELNSGFWRATNNSTLFRECPFKGACQGGSVPRAQCSEGYKGHLCAVCDQGYASSPKDKYACIQCGSTSTSSITIAAFLFLVAVCLSFLAYRRRSDIEAMVNRVNSRLHGQKANVMAESKSRSSAATASSHSQMRPDSTNASGLAGAAGLGLGLWGWLAYRSSTSTQSRSEQLRSLRAKFKIIYSTYQIVAGFPTRFAVPYPEVFVRFGEYLSIIDLGSVFSSFSAGCWLSTYSFYDVLLIATIAPAFLISLVGLVALSTLLAPVRKQIEKTGSIAKFRQNLTAMLIFTLYIIFTSVSSVVFKTFACDSNFDNGESRLKADCAFTPNPFL